LFCFLLSFLLSIGGGEADLEDNKNCPGSSVIKVIISTSDSVLNFLLQCVIPPSDIR
jgi:hypothetical protein